MDNRQHTRIPLVLSQFYRNIARQRQDRQAESWEHRRKRSLTLPLSEATPYQSTLEQSKSAFMSKLPPEIRTMIYKMALDCGVDVVHVMKKQRRPLEFVRCKGVCEMDYNYRCSTSDNSGGVEAPLSKELVVYKGLLPLLQICRKM